MKNEKVFASLFAVSAASLALAGLPNYVVTPLGDADGGYFFSRAFDINDNGTIVGSSKILFDEIQQVAVRWTPGASEPEVLDGLADFDFSRGQTVNNLGLIGGYRDILGATRRAWLWDPDNGVDFFLGDLNNPDITFSRMGDVTNFGAVTGWLRFSDPASGTRGYIFDLDTEEITILDPIGPEGNQSLAQTVNAFGLIVGSASEFPEREKPFRDAVAWSPGQTTPNVLPGMFNFSSYEETSATFVTADGVIVGSAGNRSNDGILFAQNENWIWDPATQSAEAMGFIDGLDWTKVGAINDDATFAVGFGYKDGEHLAVYLENHVGAIWTPDGGWVDVNSLINGGPDGYIIVELSGMNSYGEIVGTAINPNGDIEAVLLSPSCLSLEIDNFMVGEEASIRVARGTPGARTAILAGFGGSPSSFNGVKDWCATFGFDVRMTGKKIRVTSSGIFNNDGIYEASVFVREKVRGMTLLFQAAEQGTCPNECMSNIVEIVAQ